MELLPLDCDDNERSLGWHALNYRTAHSLHAQGMYEELERFVRAYALEAIAAERERCAQLCETLNHGAFGNSSYLSGIQDGSVGCAAAIRAQGSKA